MGLCGLQKQLYGPTGALVTFGWRLEVNVEFCSFTRLPNFTLRLTETEIPTSSQHVMSNHLRLCFGASAEAN